MRISSRDLRKLINEELRRSIGLREIRVASGPEAAPSGAARGADEDEEEEDDEETPAGKEEDEEEVSDDDRYDDYLSIERNITKLMNVEEVLVPQLPDVKVGLKDILKNGKASKYAVAVMDTLGAGETEKLNEDQLALAVIAALKTGRSAGVKKTASRYFMDTLNFDFDWWWDTNFEDAYQDVKFIEPLVEFINSK